MDTTGEGCANFFVWLGVGLVVLLTLVVPIAAFLLNPQEGLPFLFLGIPVFAYFLAGFLGFENHKVFLGALYGSIGIGVILLLRLIFLQVRETFAKDAPSGMAEALAIPVAVVVYGLVLWLLPKGLGEGKRKILSPILKFIVFLILSALVYLIYR